LGNQSVSSQESFTVQGPTGRLLSRGLDVRELNQLGYVDIAFEAYSGGTLDVSSIQDAGAEFMISGSGAGDVEFQGAPEALPDAGWYRYFFTGQFQAGQVEFQFLANSWSDSNLLGGHQSRFERLHLDRTQLSEKPLSRRVANLGATASLTKQPIQHAKGRHG
jgi:hypothetical protein